MKPRYAQQLMTEPRKSHRLIIAIYSSIGIWFIAMLTLAVYQLAHPTTMVWQSDAQNQEVMTFLIASCIAWLVSIGAIWKQERAGSSLLDLDSLEVIDLIRFAGIATLLLGGALSQTPWMHLYIPAGPVTIIFGSIVVAIAMYRRNIKSQGRFIIFHRLALIFVLVMIVYEILYPLQIHL